MNPLGAPIGEHPTGEHGAGTGLSGSQGVAGVNAHNSQSGFAQSGFNAGLGGEHASSGIPHGHSGSNHPIADKFTSGNHGSSGLTGDKLDNSLDNYGGNSHSHHGHSHTGAGLAGAGVGAGLAGVGSHGLDTQSRNIPSEDGVSGAYAGSGASDALTGESHAQRTGAGVGPLGENTGSGLGAGAAGAGAGAGVANLATAKSDVDTRGVDPSTYGTGVGASGGSGGHYDPSSVKKDSDKSGLGAGAAAVGAGAAGAGAASGAKGHFGTEEKDFERGAPISNPKDLDTGGPHSLVFQESTGKYVHRHELEGHK